MSEYPAWGSVWNRITPPTNRSRAKFVIDAVTDYSIGISSKDPYPHLVVGRIEARIDIDMVLVFADMINEIWEDPDNKLVDIEMPNIGIKLQKMRLIQTLTKITQGEVRSLSILHLGFTPAPINDSVRSRALETSIQRQGRHNSGAAGSPQTQINIDNMLLLRRLAEQYNIPVSDIL